MQGGVDRRKIPGDRVGVDDQIGKCWGSAVPPEKVLAGSPSKAWAGAEGMPSDSQLPERVRNLCQRLKERQHQPESADRERTACGRREV